MRLGICASVQVAAQLPGEAFDYLEESVQRFLIPERPQEEFEMLLQAARKLSVPVEAANVFFPSDLPLIATPQQAVDFPRLQRYVKTALQRAEQAGIHIIVFGSGKARSNPANYSHVDATRQISGHLAAWSELAREHGVEIVLEPLRYAECNVLNTIAEGGALISQLAQTGTTHARLLADTYHMASNQEDPATLQTYVPLISHVHVAELQDRATPGTHDEDFRPYFAVLRRGNYDQRISIECNWQDLPNQLGIALATLYEHWETCLQA